MPRGKFVVSVFKNRLEDICGPRRRENERSQRSAKALPDRGRTKSRGREKKEGVGLEGKGVILARVEDETN